MVDGASFFTGGKAAMVKSVPVVSESNMCKKTGWWLVFELAKIRLSGGLCLWDPKSNKSMMALLWRKGRYREACVGPN